MDIQRAGKRETESNQLQKGDQQVRRDPSVVGFCGIEEHLEKMESIDWIIILKLETDGRKYKSSEREREIFSFTYRIISIKDCTVAVVDN